MTKKLILALYILLAAASHAQESNSVFNFLEMPVSAHSTALGGRNISLIEKLEEYGLKYKFKQS